MCCRRQYSWDTRENKTQSGGRVGVFPCRQPRGVESYEASTTSSDIVFGMPVDVLVSASCVGRRLSIVSRAANEGGEGRLSDPALPALRSSRDNVRSFADTDRGLHGAISTAHGKQEVRQAAQRAFTIDKVGGLDEASFDEGQRAADGARGVMEAGQQREV